MVPENRRSLRPLRFASRSRFATGVSLRSSISRDTNYSSNYPEVYDNDSIVLQKQKAIRIVRNEEERGISIKLRGRKNAKNLIENEKESPVPIVD